MSYKQGGTPIFHGSVGKVVGEIDRSVCIYLSIAEHEMIRGCLLREWQGIVDSLRTFFPEPSMADRMAKDQRREVWELVKLFERRKA